MENQALGFSKILVATDFSKDADAALGQAMWLAERCAATVTVTHVLTDVRTALLEMPTEARWQLVAGDIDEFERALRRKADDRLDGLLAPHRGGPVALRSETLLGVPFVEIIHAVQKEGHDLVVAGTRGLSGVKRFVVGSTAEQLVRMCPCPIWIVKPEDQEPIRSLLVAVDFSQASGKALELAASLAIQFGCQLNVLHVFDVPAGESIEALELVIGSKRGGHIQQVKRAVRQQLCDFVAAHVPHEVKAEMRLASGKPWKVITSSVRRLGVDLVVMGSVARSGIPGFFIGNTADKVLRTCDRSILTLKPDGFVSPVQPAFWSLHPATAAPLMHPKLEELADR
jgi:universal stress protein E